MMIVARRLALLHQHLAPLLFSLLRRLVGVEVARRVCCWGSTAAAAVGSTIEGTAILVLIFIIV